MGFKRNYSVEITEIRHIDINIEADTEKEALAKAKKYDVDGKYKIQDIVAAEFEITNETNKK